jgi:hypothetical protein
VSHANAKRRITVKEADVTSDLLPVPKRWSAWALAGFAAGFVSVLVFHQVAVASVGALTGRPVNPWSLVPVAPFGVPRVLSTAFWGGVWGIPLALVLRRFGATLVPWLVVGLVFGALLPSLAGWFIVAPLRGQPMGAGGDPARMMVGLLVNGTWGLGTAVLLWPFVQRLRAPSAIR